MSTPPQKSVVSLDYYAQTHTQQAAYLPSRILDEKERQQHKTAPPFAVPPTARTWIKKSANSTKPHLSLSHPHHARDRFVFFRDDVEDSIQREEDIS